MSPVPTVAAFCQAEGRLSLFEHTRPKRHFFESELAVFLALRSGNTYAPHTLIVPVFTRGFVLARGQDVGTDEPDAPVAQPVRRWSVQWPEESNHRRSRQHDEQ